MSKKPSVVVAFMAMVVVGITFVAVVEIGLRLMDFPKRDPDQSVLYYQQIEFPLFRSTTLKDGTDVFRATDERLGSQQFLAKKAPNTYRVFAFGGSATNGLGYSPNVTFTRYLHDYLSAIYPEVHFEVINVGIIGFSSKQEKALVEHVRKSYDPDLLVVYAGNNEFLELHARMFTEPNLNANVLKMQDRLNHAYLYRALKFAIQRVKDANQGQDGREAQFAKFAFSESELTADLHVTGNEHAYIQKKYAKNFSDIVDTVGDSPIFLMTVASNLRWNDPDDLRSDWLRTFLESQTPQASPTLNVESPIQGPMTHAHALRAVELLQAQLRAIEHGQSPKADAGDSVQLARTGVDAVHYRLGKAFELLGNHDRARNEFKLARDLDRRSRRALGVFNETILSFKALETKMPNLRVIDTESLLAAKAPHGIIGYETFYDYVHFSPEGAQRMAEVISRSIVEERFVNERLASRFKITQEIPFDYDAFIREQAAALAERRIDYPQVDQWIGFNFDPSDVKAVNLFKYREAVDALQKMAEMGRVDPWVYTFLGNAYFFRLGEEENTLKNYRKALALLSPKDLDLRGALYQNLAYFYRKQGEGQKAGKILAFYRSYERNARDGGEEVALDNLLKVK